MRLKVKVNNFTLFCDNMIVLLAISVGCLLLSFTNCVQSAKTPGKSTAQSKSSRDDLSDSDSSASGMSDGLGVSGILNPPSKYSYPVYQTPGSSSNSFYPSAYSPYNPYYNYLTGPYYDRVAREFSARSTTLPMMAVASSQVGFQDASPEYAGLALASGGGHGHSGGHGGGEGHGHGHTGGQTGHGSSGWGAQHGWKKGHTYYENVSKVDTSSLGLLGLLGLLSLLSNVLLLITTTTAASGRKKRSAVDSKYLDLSPISFLEPRIEESEVSKTERVCQLVLPSLNVVAHASYGKVPLNCTHREVCITNRILVNEIGMEGRSVGATLSSAIAKLLKPMDKGGDIGDQVVNASLVGRNGQDCEKVFPLCDDFNGTAYSLPELISPTKISAIARGETTKFI